MWINWLIVSIMGFIIARHNKLQVSNIVIKFIKIFYDDRREDKKISIIDLIVIFFLPMVISIILVWRIEIEIMAISELLTIISILSGLMFSMLPLLINIRRNQNLNYIKVVNETFDAVSFEILLGIITLLFIVLSSSNTDIIGNIIDTITLYLIFIYIATLMIILKRIFIIFDKESKII